MDEGRARKYLLSTHGLSDEAAAWVTQRRIDMENEEREEEVPVIFYCLRSKGNQKWLGVSGWANPTGLVLNWNKAIQFPTLEAAQAAVWSDLEVRRMILRSEAV